MAACTPNPENHRKTFDAVAMGELAESIVQHGLLQPIAVRKLGDDELSGLPVAAAAAHAERFEIILGERRWRAHVALELGMIEAKVYAGVTRRQAKAAALVENLQRQDINPIEEAEGYQDLMQTEGITQEQVAQRVGRSRPVVANALRVLALPAPVLELIREKKLTMAHGVQLVRWARWPAACTQIAECCLNGRSTAGDLEEEDLPYAWDLERQKLCVQIYTYNYTVGKEFREDPDFIVPKRSNCITCMAPEKWAPEKARQDALKRKGESVRSGSNGAATGGTMTAAELAARKKKIATNKRNREQTEAQLVAVQTRLKAATGYDPAAILVVVREALSAHGRTGGNIKPTAAALGLTLPKRGDVADSYEALALLKPEDQLRLAAAAIAAREASYALTNAWECPEELTLLAPVVKAPAPKPVAKAKPAKAAKKGGRK